MIAIAALAFGIAAIDLGRAIAYARALAFAQQISADWTFPQCSTLQLPLQL